MRLAANLPRLLQSFFTQRLMSQRQASPHTIASYRDTFRLLLAYVQGALGKEPATLALEDVTPELIGAFLDHLEQVRANSARSRNVRLAAIRSFFRYAAFQEPANGAHIQRVLAIPNKRAERALIHFLSRAEIDALLRAPDRNTRAGRRDRALLLLAIQTGLRVSELIGLRRTDLVLGTGPHVRCTGKGRKERRTPLTKQTAAVLRCWLQECGSDAADPIFPNARGNALSRDGVEHILTKHTKVAARECPSLSRKRVSPHVLRHTAAMSLLRAGVDRSVIALWLGHESVETTQMYLNADLELKEEALEKVRPLHVRPGRYRPDDRLLAFLNNL